MTKRWELKKHDYRAVYARRKDFRALLEERYRLADLASHELVFGELVANAVRHGEDPIEVEVALNDDGIVQIDVENAGKCEAGECFRPDRPRIAPPAPTATGGRGLEIVRALSETFTFEHSPSHVSRVSVTLKIGGSPKAGARF